MPSRHLSLSSIALIQQHRFMGAGPPSDPADGGGPLSFSPQGIYSCFSGVQTMASPGRAPTPDVTANSAQANVLKMLQAAKEMVSTASVGGSLEQATRTIEDWSSHSERLQTTFSLRTPQLVVQNSTGAHRAPSYSTAPTERLGRAYTPKGAPLGLPLPQPVPVDSRLPAEEKWRGANEHVPRLLHPLKFRGGCAGDEALPGFPHLLVKTSPGGDFGEQALMGNHIGAPLPTPTSPRDLPPPDIYREHKRPAGRGERLQNTPLLPGDGGHGGSGTLPRLLSAAEKRREVGSPFLPPSCPRGAFPKATRTCRAVGEVARPEAAVMEREKPNRRASSARVPGERGEKRRTGGLRRCSAARLPARADVPDLFPDAEAGYGCGPRCPQATGRLAPRSPVVRLPSYREACRQNPRVTATVPACTPYACMNSYGNLPLYLGHLSRGSPPPREHPGVPAGCGRGSGRWDSGCRDCGWRGEPALLRAAGTERRDPLVARGVTSPCAGGSWRRVSSLESEV